jgi:hypothetical protein
MRALFVTAFLTLTASVGACYAESSVPPCKPITEEAIRLASNRLYTDILVRASLNGWRFAPDKIKNGYERHFQELRLQFIDQGYTIVPGTPSLASTRQPSE